MPATTAGFSALLDANVYEIYVDTRAEVPPQAPLIFNMPTLVRQNLQFQEYAGLGQMPAKAEGTQFVLDRPVVGGTKTYTANSFGMPFQCVISTPGVSAASATRCSATFDTIHFDASPSK